MHTFKGNTSNIHFNGDYSGNIIISSNYGLGQVKIDISDMIGFFNNAVLQDGLDWNLISKEVSTDEYIKSVQEDFSKMTF